MAERKKQNRPNRKPELRTFDKEAWKPKTELGKKVKSGEISDIKEILFSGKKILEAEIVDSLIPELEYDLLAIGQSKGKFGGGKRSIWKQTQKKTKEGNKPNFSTIAVVGNKNGYVGVGKGKAKETVPAREKAIRQAKLNIISVSRGCGSWECGCRTPHTIPFAVTGKSGSVVVNLMPAPKGVGLITEKQISKILQFAGFKDVYSKARGHTATKINLVYACFNALKKLNDMKIRQDYIQKGGVVLGSLKDGKEKTSDSEN